MEIFNIIGLACLSYLFIAAEPMILLKRLIGFKEENYMSFSKTKQFFHRMITCGMCSGFWIALATTQNIMAAGIVSLLAELITKLFNRQ